MLGGAGDRAKSLAEERAVAVADPDRLLEAEDGGEQFLARGGALDRSEVLETVERLAEAVRGVRHAWHARKVAPASPNLTAAQAFAGAGAADPVAERGVERGCWARAKPGGRTLVIFPPADAT
jgi:hypothetical protein